MSYDHIRLDGATRQAVRDAIRTIIRTNHPARDPVAARIAGRKINDLPKADLLDIATMLGIDVAQLNEPRPHTQAEVTQAYEAAKKRRASANELVSDPSAPFVLAPRSMWKPGQVPEGIAAAPAETEAQQETETQDAPAIRPSFATEAEAIRREIATHMVEGHFDAVTRRITELVAAAHKPAEVRIVEKVETIYVDAASVPAGVTLHAAPPIPVPAAKTTETWHKLFGISGAMGKKHINVFEAHPTTPAVDARYQWPDQVTQAALLAFGRPNGNVWLYGPAGTGKTSFAEQLAARTGRPFYLIPCDDTTEAPELVGMTVPHAGGVRWQDGVLTAALRVPHAIILIDEPTVARAGAMMVFQSVLASRCLSIKETGEMVRVAEGIRFICADNTNGTGGGNEEGYEGTRRMNRATLDRFSAFLRVDYMPADKEAAALVSHTQCTPELARVLIECADLSRKARVTHAIGLRRLIAWAEALTDGLDPRAAFEFTILNSCARDDREPTEQCCALALDKRAITLALAGTTPAALPTPSTSKAAADFA